jgi:site-specific DNA-cytosine methylase
MRRLKCEKETIILTNEDDGFYDVYTFNQSLQKRLRAFAEKYPDDCWLLLSANGWFKDEIIQTIEKLGYYVNVDVLNAADFGVPQSRERAIFICSKQMPISLPKPTVSKRTTVRDAIEDLAYLNSGEGAYEQEYITEAKSLYQVQSRKGSDKLYNHKASNHKQVAIDKLKLIPPEQGKECLPAELHGNQKFRTTWGKGLQMLQGIFVKVIMLIMSRSIGYILKYHIIGN